MGPLTLQVRLATWGPNMSMLESLKERNMNPPWLLQVRRYEDVRLGVTYESEVECESGGLGYTWTLSDSAAQVVPLALIDVHKQTLVLPRHFLDYGTYTATARVRAKNETHYFL